MAAEATARYLNTDQLAADLYVGLTRAGAQSAIRVLAEFRADATDAQYAAAFQTRVDGHATRNTALDLLAGLLETMRAFPSHTVGPNEVPLGAPAVMNSPAAQALYDWLVRPLRRIEAVERLRNVFGPSGGPSAVSRGVGAVDRKTINRVAASALRAAKKGAKFSADALILSLVVEYHRRCYPGQLFADTATAPSIMAAVASIRPNPPQ